MQTVCWDPPLRGRGDHGLGPLLRGRADRASQGISAPGTRLGPEPPSCCGWRMRWGLAPSGWAETSRGARSRPTHSLQRLPQALIVLYAFHFPHLLSPQIERSAHRGLYRQHILGIIMRGPALCLAAAGFSLFFYPAVSPGPARSCHGTQQRAWDAWLSTRAWGCGQLREEVGKDLPEPGRTEVEEREVQARWAGHHRAQEDRVRKTAAAGGAAPDSVLAELQPEISPTSGASGQLLPLPALWVKQSEPLNPKPHKKCEGMHFKHLVNVSREFQI